VNALVSTALRGVTCPTCTGSGRVFGINPSPTSSGQECGDCFGAGFIRADRRTTREVYEANRGYAFRAERDAALLRYSDPRSARVFEREAAVLRAELSAPADPKEAARNARWHKLAAALILARRATSQMRSARELARAA
jgi:hypothetical protein